MTDLLQDALQEKRQFIIDELIKSGIYKINDKHLYESPLIELEKEFKAMDNLFPVRNSIHIPC